MVDTDRRAQVRAELMDELTWPASTGQVIGAAEMQDDPEVAAAAKRLPDDGTWLQIEELWQDLEPLLDDLEAS